MILLIAVKMCPHTFFQAVPADENRLIILRVPGGICGLRDRRRAQQKALTRRERCGKNAEVFLNCVYERAGRFVERQYQIIKSGVFFAPVEQMCS